MKYTKKDLETALYLAARIIMTRNPEITLFQPQQGFTPWEEALNEQLEKVRKRDAQAREQPRTRAETNDHGESKHPYSKNVE